MLDPVATFQNQRPRLFGLAYHILGSVSDAEDVVQDAYLRWHHVDHARVEQPQAFLTRTVTNLCLDTAALAHRKRTDYIGEWLPDPLIEQEGDAIEQEERLSLAVMRLMEQLTPTERAVFVLRELFDYPYRDISDIVGKSEAACRQLERRARQKVQRDTTPTAIETSAAEQWLWRFVQAVRDGDLGPVMQCLAEEAVLYSDGGGKAKTALKPVVGAEHLARFFVGLNRKVAIPLVVRPIRLNSSVGLLLLVDDQPLQIIAFELEGERAREVQIMANPDKLAAILAHAQRS